MTAWSKNRQRKLGWFYLVVAVTTLIVAFVQQPISDWGSLGLVLGLVIAFAGIDGLIMGLTGTDISFGWLTMQPGRPTAQYESRLSARAERTFAIVGLVAVTIMAFGLVLDDVNSFTATDTLGVGFWVGAAGLFIAQIAGAGSERSGATSGRA